MAYQHDQPTPTSPKLATSDTAKLAGQIDDLETKAARAHDAGDRSLERSYIARVDLLRKGVDDTGAPLLSPDGGIPVRQQLLDLAGMYASQAIQARTSNTSRANALTATAAQLLQRVTDLGRAAA